MALISSGAPEAAQISEGSSSAAAHPGHLQRKHTALRLPCRAASLRGEVREAEGSEEPGDKGRLAPRQSGERSALVTAGVLSASPRAPAQTKQVCMGSVLMGSVQSFLA